MDTPNIPRAAAPISEALRWVADISSLAGEPESAEFQASLTTVVLTLRSERQLRDWALTIGAADVDIPDVLGVMVQATAKVEDSWRVLLYAHTRMVTR